jgi:hypothetical protein
MVVSSHLKITYLSGNVAMLFERFDLTLFLVSVGWVSWIFFDEPVNPTYPGFIVQLRWPIPIPSIYFHVLML